MATKVLCTCTKLARTFILKLQQKFLKKEIMNGMGMVYPHN
jgi:hypothetical protein